MKLLCLLLLAALTCCLMGGPLSAEQKAIGVSQQNTPKPAEHLGENRYALLVGVDDYKDPAVPDLTICEQDARAMRDLLVDPNVVGIDEKNVTMLLGKEASFINIRKALLNLSRVPADSTVFIYFSGHGAKEQGEAFWITQDAELSNLAATAFPDREVRAFLERIPSQRVIVILDCCYAAATVKGDKTAIGDFSEVLSRFTGKGRAFLMAAGSGEEAIEAQDLKHSVFTHYVLSGLRGQSDSNSDGVVSLTELIAYIDRHVADEARVRGGIQRPVVRMEQVQEPAKFRLSIDPVRLKQSLRETAQVKAVRQGRIAKLESFYIEEKLTRDQAQQGVHLLKADPATLGTDDQKRLGYYERVADGKFDSAKLQRALDFIESPAQREARLAAAAEARLAQKRKEEIATLLGHAKLNDNKRDGRAAIIQLDRILELDPTHGEAKKLKAKIQAYYVSPDRPKEKDLNTDYLDQNAKKPDVVTTNSGLQYKVLRSGDGKSPGPNDTVTVHYAGRLTDGKEFDSSYTRGQPAEFPVGGVIQGWVEGLQLMKVGDKFELVIPPDLGYGERGAGGLIGPNAVLIFEVELLGIK